MTEPISRVSSLPWGLRPNDLGVAAATGLLALPDPARRTPLTRFALRTAIAAAAAAAVWTGSREDSEFQNNLSLRVGLTTGAVGLVFGAAELGEALDGALQRRLVRMGVRRPRIVMAVGGVVLALATSVLERRAEDETDESDDAPEPTYREVPQPVRDLVGVILEQTEDHDSLRLRAQLAVAQEEVWGQEDGPSRFVELSVPDGVALAVPHDFTFPVSARFVTPRGVPCVVQLLIGGGRLTSVLLDVAAEEWEQVGDEWEPGDGDADPLADATWPVLGEIILVTESSGRR